MKCNLFVLCFLFCIVLQRSGAIQYPLYKQCNSMWGNDTMGVPGHPDEDDTICNQGCAMSCVAMALAGHGITIEGKVATPGSLNKWLQAKNGYECLDGDCCNLILNAPEALAPNRIRCLGEPQVPFFSTLKKFVMDGLSVLAHVRHQHHFVLLLGMDPTQEQSFVVNDPGFNQHSYNYSDIHDVIVYDIL